MRKCFITVALLALVFITGFGATFSGYWGGSYPELHKKAPDIYKFARGYWRSYPICWNFSGGGTKAWTSEEILTSEQAVNQWNDIEEVNNMQNPLHNRIRNASHPDCAGKDPDILLQWGNAGSVFKRHGDLNNDGISTSLENFVGYFVPERVASPDNLKYQPCPDLLAVNIIAQCNVILLNERPSSVTLTPAWFTSLPTEPPTDFVQSTRQFCDEAAPTGVQEAVAGGPADGRPDLFTIVGHEFGHALGLIHTEGCDTDVFTNPKPDDDGLLLWGGKLDGQREASPLGASDESLLGVRKFVDADSLQQLDRIYGDARFDASGAISLEAHAAPKGIAAYSTNGCAECGRICDEGCAAVAAGGLNALAIVALSEGAAAASALAADLHHNQPRLLAAAAPRYIRVGTNPLFVEISADQRFAFTVNVGSNDISVVDLGLQILIQLIRVGNLPVAMDYDINSQRLYVVNQGDNSMSIVDASETGRRLIATITGVETPVDVIVSNDGNRVYVSEINGSVAVIDTASSRIIGRVQLTGMELRRLAISHDDALLYVAARRPDGTGRIGVIDTARQTLQKYIDVEQTPLGLEITPSGKCLVVTHSTFSKVSLIQLTSGKTLVGQEATANEAQEALIMGNELFVTNGVSGTISVFTLFGNCW